MVVVVNGFYMKMILEIGVDFEKGKEKIVKKNLLMFIFYFMEILLNFIVNYCWMI